MPNLMGNQRPVQRQPVPVPTDPILQSRGQPAPPRPFLPQACHLDATDLRASVLAQMAPDASGNS